jgi:D-sedoheptulose 7-phosphate isomerase
MKDHVAVVEKLDQPGIAVAADLIVRALRKGNTLLICGNGGSAADAQHFSAELTGRYKTERRGLPALALTTDTSALTAIANDYGFDLVFSRQIEALGRKGDVLVLLSTSGNSINIAKAAGKAKAMGITTLALLGKGGGALKGVCDHEIIIPSADTPRIQEMHGLIIHCICERIDESMNQGGTAGGRV